ncbi:hypothetical protein FKP32DRAFT_1689223 [Trametes sanguinea]|nr:hypothetical protein FKP32DRAFT_1689223 [Trametes sanguinea]
MNNGDGRQTNPYPAGELVPFAPNSIVTPEDFEANRARIEQVKAALAFYEQQNMQGLQRFYEERQALEAAVEQGRLAAQRLAELQGQAVTDIFPTAPVPAPGPVPGPSTFSAGQAQYPASQQQRASAQGVAELPTSARIVEIPSPRVDAHAATAPSVQGGYYAQGQQRPAGHSGPLPPQYANAASIFSAGAANPQAAQAPGQYVAAQPTRMGGVYQQQQPNQQAAQANMYAEGRRQQPALPRRHPMPQQASQPAHANRTASGSSQRHVTPQSAAAVESPIPGPSRQAQTSEASSESRYGTSTTSSLAGALGGASSPSTESVPHAQVTYASRHSARTQPAPAEPRKSSINLHEEEQLFEFFKRLGPPMVQRLMAQSLTMIQRKQTGGPVSAVEEEAKKDLNGPMQHACEMISERLKKYPITELKQLFLKFWRDLNVTREQAQHYSAGIEKVPSTQPSAPNQPSTSAQPAPNQPSTSAQPALYGAPHQAAPAPVQNPVRQNVPAAFTRTPLPDISATRTAATNAFPANRPDADKYVHQGTLNWYSPGDPRMPVAYRDGQGQIRYMYAPPSASAQHVPFGNALSLPQRPSSSMPPPVVAPNMRTPEKPNVRSPSPWTPEKSDRRRLAQDILRSLGRPKGAFGDPLIEQPTTSATASASVIVEQNGSDNGKRKPSDSPGDATPSKRRRKEEESPQQSASALAPPSAPPRDGSEVIDLTTPPSEETLETMRASQGPVPISSADVVAGAAATRMSEELGQAAEPERTSPKSQPKATVVTDAEAPEKQTSAEEEEEKRDIEAILPAFGRGESVASSEADAEKVQAMFIEHDVPDSAPSGPSSVGKPSPPPVAPDFVDLPSVDGQLFSIGTDEAASASNSADLLAQHAAAQQTRMPSSPARGDKIPLFLPSPSSSPGASGSAHEGSLPPASEDVLSDGEAPPRPLYGHKHKGKGKARERSVDIDLTMESRSVSPASSPRRMGREVFVVVPPLPPYAKRKKVRRDSSPDGTESDVSREAIRPIIIPRRVGLSQNHSSHTSVGSRTDAEERSRAANAAALSQQVVPPSSSVSVRSASVDPLAQWDDPELLETRPRTYEEEAREAAQISYDRMREVPCLWTGCGAVLNSMSTLQKHVVLHAADNEAWGTYGCNWHSCSHKFSDEAKLAHHLRKHAMTPLFCPYEGCDKSFNTPEAFLAHHKSSKHRDGTLRRSTQPFAPVIRRELTPLPEVLPAYMSVPRRVARHPISKERHQWLGPKVLENITAFKYSGGRSNAALPARSRRLAEKVAAAELAEVSPEAALERIKRWIDDDYLAFADGYDAARRSGLRCADVPSQEITQILDAGFVFWPPEEDVKEAQAKAASLDERAPPGEQHGPDAQEDGHPELSADADKDARQELEEPSHIGPVLPPPPAATTSTIQNTSGADPAGPSGTADSAEAPVAVLASAADDSEAGAGVDQVAEDVMLGSAGDGGQERGHSGEDGHGRMSDAVMSASEAGDGFAAGGQQRRLELPRRSNVAVHSGSPPTTDRVAGGGGGGGGGGDGAGLQTTEVQPDEASTMLAAQMMAPGSTEQYDGSEEMHSSSSSPPSAFPAAAVAAATAHDDQLLPAMQSLPSPGYLSARSAEVILSDVRPIKLKLEALQAVNVLLDEFLYSILSASRSLATDKLKAALLKVLPTSLGKEALLEAEVELKAYWERTTSARSPSSARNADGTDFDLQWSFELLRLKCEAYSTMNDSDEDAEAEKRLQQKMEAAGSSSPPNPSLLAPAALYLTAILEAICEHVLANVSRVAARDSSRTLATVPDLLTALCEDEGIYVAVKPMKAFEQIESLSKAQRPRRSKSFSRSTDKTMSRTSTSSPTPSRAARMSTDSTKSNAPTVNEARRTSIEKTRAVKIFHSRSLSDREKHEPAVAGPLARSQSEIGINREYPAEFEASACCDDEELQQEFDELMRSGATMKVSLTPDRLKSMEVYKQERTDRERGARRVGQGSTIPATLQTTEKLADGGAATGEGKRGATANGRPPLRHVDSIVEDDEETSSAANHQQSSLPAPSFQSNAASGSASASARIRNTSFTASPSPAMVRANDQRLRAISISNVPHPRHEDGITRKAPTKPPMPQRQGSQNAMPPPPLPPQVVNGGGQMGTPKRTRKMGRNRESMDLDDIMNGSDGEDAGGAVEQPAATAPLRSPGSVSSRNSDTASTATSPRKPHISRQAQDLIAFLEAGPPEEPAYNPSMNASVISFESSKTRSGRLQRMMSRLTLGGSKESLNGGAIPEEMGGGGGGFGFGSGGPKTPRSLSRKNSSKAALNMGMSTPPPSFKAASLASKRSIPESVGMQPYPNVIVATPPPRPVLQTASAILAEPASTPSSSHGSREDVSSQAPSLTRRSTRKAVPAFDDAVSPSSEDARGSVNGHRYSSRDPDGGMGPTSPGSVVRKPVQPNGHPVKIDTSEASLHPRSITSPASATERDRKSPRSHAKAESGYASRSASRSPVTPSERLPPPPTPPSAPAIPTSDVEDLRRLMACATSADECRLLVDMFLAKNALLPKTEPPAPVAAKAPAATLEEALDLARRGDDEIERGTSAPAGSLRLSMSLGWDLDMIPFPLSLSAPTLTLTSADEGSTVPLSSPFPRMSIDPHVVSLYRIYLSGLGLDSGT